MSTSITRKTLNLDDKVKAINLCDGGKSCRAVAEEMGVLPVLQVIYYSQNVK
jgi:hypothetical protein